MGTTLYLWKARCWPCHDDTAFSVALLRGGDSPVSLTSPQPAGLRVMLGSLLLFMAMVRHGNSSSLKIYSAGARAVTLCHSLILVTASLQTPASAPFYPDFKLGSSFSPAITLFLNDVYIQDNFCNVLVTLRVVMREFYCSHRK